MFTGIIECLGKVLESRREGSNVHFKVSSPISHELKIDQSISHNGVCLTVVEQSADWHIVTIIDESLKKSNLGAIQVGDLVNLERCMPANGRYDGHIVQGHVDGMGKCIAIEEQNGSWLFHFEHPKNTHFLTVEKGSITINGVSLTCFNSTENSFSVAIIPYTFEHTTFKNLRPGDQVNLEFDIVGKYVQKLMQRK